MHEPVRACSQRKSDGMASGEATLPKKPLARTSKLAPRSRDIVAAKRRVLCEGRRMNRAALGVEQQCRECHGVVIRVHGLIERVVQFDEPCGKGFRHAV